MPKGAWTDEEKAVLRKRWVAGDDAKVIASAVGRSRRSVHAAAKRLGLGAREQKRKQPKRRPGDEWTESQLEILTEMWERGEPARAISEAVGRSESSVYNKAANMGLKRPEKPQAGAKQIERDTEPEKPRPGAPPRVLVEETPASGFLVSGGQGGLEEDAKPATRGSEATRRMLGGPGDDEDGDVLVEAASKGSLRLRDALVDCGELVEKLGRAMRSAGTACNEAFVTCTEGVRSGDPCVAGTSIRVESIAERCRHRGVDEVAADLGLDPAHARLAVEMWGRLKGDGIEDSRRLTKLEGERIELDNKVRELEDELVSEWAKVASWREAAQRQFRANANMIRTLSPGFDVEQGWKDIVREVDEKSETEYRERIAAAKATTPASEVEAQGDDG